MSDYIHARREGEVILFRMWSSIAEGYLSKPLDREGMKAWTLSKNHTALFDVIYTEEMIEKELQLAETRGIGDKTMRARSLNWNWQKND